MRYMSISKVIFGITLLLVLPVSTTAEVCNGQCENGNSYAVQDLGDTTRIVVFEYDGGDGSGLESYYTDESTGSACARLSRQYCG